MKISLLILTLFWSCFAFGQEEESEANVCDCFITSPESDLVSFTNILSFTNFFPPELMKKENIKSIILNKVDTDGMPTIHVNNDDIVKFILDNEGRLVERNELDYNSFFTWKGKLNHVKDIFYYNTDNRIDTIHNYYDFSKDGTRMVHEREDNNDWRINYHTIYHYKNDTLLKVTNYFGDKITSERSIQFQKDENIALVKATGDLSYENYTDTIFFNKKAQVIKEVHWSFGHGSSYKQERQYTYNTNGRVKTQRIDIVNTTTEYKNDEDEKGEQRIYKHFNKSTYTYNSNSLLTHINLQMNDETCEKTVYYYTE